jgi:hypothetical protein
LVCIGGISNLIAGKGEDSLRPLVKIGILLGKLLADLVSGISVFPAKAGAGIIINEIAARSRIALRRFIVTVYKGIIRAACIIRPKKTK